MRESADSVRPLPRRGADGKSQVQDDLIMGTNNRSIVSKRSVERLYYPNEPHFFQYFVKKPRRRSPLINRGYWLRMKAIDHVVYQFLEQPSKKTKVVINLGCGYNPLPWQCLSRYPGLCKDVLFIDVDYEDLMAKKRDMVEQTAELRSLVTNPEFLVEGSLLLRSLEYLQIGCDLRDLARLSKTLTSFLDFQSCRVLFVAEVSITYMNIDSADNLIQWAGKLPEARFCLLEQILPDGISHPFAQTMMAHFDKLKTPLRAVEKYPTTDAQYQRFQGLGWASASVRNLWELWGDQGFLCSADRQSLDTIEPFDEWEEFALFGCHYFLLVANNVTSSKSLGGANDVVYLTPPQSHLKDSGQPLRIESTYSVNPRGQGCRRFASGLPLKGSHLGNLKIGNFAGFGLKTRLNSYDVYATDQQESFQVKPQHSLTYPTSRLCHTITDLGNAGALLVGGRASPDSGLVDCWLYHKWVDMWERVDDLPQALYRHQAVALGAGFVLVSTGRVSSSAISHEYLVWSRHSGWVKCHLDGDERPPPTYGAILCLSDEETWLGEPMVRSGILAGGMSIEGLIQQDVWEWKLRDLSSNRPILHFRRSTAFSKGSNATLCLARFGASVTRHNKKTYIIGGIAKNVLLGASEELCALDDSCRQILQVLPNNGPLTPRPLLVGITVMIGGPECLLIMGGSAVCFSFGAFWNSGCFLLQLDKPHKVPMHDKEPTTPSQIWSFVDTIVPPPIGTSTFMTSPESERLARVPRVTLNSPAEFK